MILVLAAWLACPFPIVGHGVVFCLDRPPSSSRIVLQELADRGYPLATFLRFGQDTAYVDEGPLVPAGAIRVHPPHGTLLRWFQGRSGEVFRLSRVQELRSWLGWVGFTTDLRWDGTHPVVRWSLPPPRGLATLTWNRTGFLGNGRLSGWIPAWLTRLDLQVEGEGDRERARLDLRRPLTVPVEGTAALAYFNADQPALSVEGGMQWGWENVVLGAGLHGVWDTTVRGGVVAWGGVQKGRGTLSIRALFRREGVFLRLQGSVEGSWGEGGGLVLAGTLVDSVLAEPRGGPGGLRGWPGTGRFLRGVRGYGGLGPPLLRLFLEGLWERGAFPLWSVALRIERENVGLWLARGLPGGRTWVYVSVRME